MVRDNAASLKGSFDAVASSDEIAQLLRNKLNRLRVQLLFLIIVRRIELVETELTCTLCICLQRIPLAKLRISSDTRKQLGRRALKGIGEGWQANRPKRSRHAINPCRTVPKELKEAAVWHL